MRDIFLEVVVGVGLAIIGALALYVFIGDRALDVDAHWLYMLGALVVSVPAIIVLERRRRSRL